MHDTLNNYSFEFDSNSQTIYESHISSFIFNNLEPKENDDLFHYYKIFLNPFENTYATRKNEVNQESNEVNDNTAPFINQPEINQDIKLLKKKGRKKNIEKLDIYGNAINKGGHNNNFLDNLQKKIKTNLIKAIMEHVYLLSNIINNILILEYFINLQNNVKSRNNISFPNE